MIKCEHCRGEHETNQRFCSVTGKLFAPERYFPPGMVLDGKYRLGDLIGAGGMGAVLEGTHVLLDKKVAIKLLLPDFAGDPEMSARLLREARAASATGHRNIALVTDLGRTTEGTLYVVMERLTGRPLDDLLRTEAPMKVPRAARILCDVLSGLDAVHRRGIVHRDLKPSNIMICTEEDGTEVVKILDFGISKQIGDLGDANLTTMGRVLGTPRFMPPEQARGREDIDHRADIYAAGAILYGMLTGKPAITGNSYNAVIAAILEGTIEPPSRHVPGLPPALDVIVLRAMANSREERYADALSFRKDLLPFTSEQPVRTQLGVGPQPGDAFEEMARPATAESKLEVVAFGEDASPARRGTARPASSDVVEPASPPSSVRLPPAALRPGAPGIPTELEPVAASAPLELAEDTRRGAVVGATVYSGPKPVSWRLVTRLLLVSVLLVAGLVGWVYRDELQQLVTGGPSSDQVMILVDTKPSDAEVFVDGVYQVTKPVPVPRSAERIYTVRVQAKGYITEERQIRADRTQVVRVALRRR